MSLRNNNKAVKGRNNAEVVDTEMSRPNHGTMSVINIMEGRASDNKQPHSGQVLSTIINDSVDEQQE